MEDTTIRVEARIVGQRSPLHTPWDIVLPAELIQQQGTTAAYRLRDLLEYIVREEVRAFRLRQEERRLARVLGPQQIADAAASGKVAMGGPRDLLSNSQEQEVDEDAAVATALQAFEDGLYFVFLNGQQQHDLNAAIELRSASTLAFIRLVALAGG